MTSTHDAFFRRRIRLTATRYPHEWFQTVRLGETAPPRPGEFQSDLCAAIQPEARRAKALGVRVVRMRFGVALGCGGGAHPIQALAARQGLGTMRGHGRQPALWVRVADAVGLVRFAMAHQTL